MNEQQPRRFNQPNVTELKRSGGLVLIHSTEPLPDNVIELPAVIESEDDDERPDIVA